MLNSEGFNLWANSYDQTVQLCEEKNEYPFAGYKAVLGYIFNEVMQKSNTNVLDIGFGTGVLTSKLYENNHTITGIDFSSNMVKIAQEKMPTAHMVEWDLTDGIPTFIKNNSYDFIISTYAFHHFNDRKKVALIKSLLGSLSKGGKILIGDVAFTTKKQLEICRKNSIECWDEAEYYFVDEQLRPLLMEWCQSEFHPKSHCAGVFVITHK